jgi:hypothetical protein
MLVSNGYSICIIAKKNEFHAAKHLLFIFIAAVLSLDEFFDLVKEIETNEVIV